MAITRASWTKTGNLRNLTWAHSISAVSRVLIVGVAVYNGDASPASAISGVKFGTSAFTLAGRASQNMNTMDMWYLVNPSVGQDNIVVNSNYAFGFDTPAIAVDYGGIDLVNPFRASWSAYITSNPASFQITGAVSTEFLLDLLAHEHANVCSATGYNTSLGYQDTGGRHLAIGETTNRSGTYSVAWSATTAMTRAAYLAIALNDGWDGSISGGVRFDDIEIGEATFLMETLNESFSMDDSATIYQLEVQNCTHSIAGDSPVLTGRVLAVNDVTHAEPLGVTALVSLSELSIADSFGFSEEVEAWTGLVGSISATLPMLEVPIDEVGIYNYTRFVANKVVEGSIGGIEGTITASRGFVGSIDKILPALTGSLSGWTQLSGSIDAEVPAITGSITASTRALNEIVGNVPALQGSMTALVGANAQVSGTLPALQGSLATIQAVNASISGTLGAIAGELHVETTEFVIYALNSKNFGFTEYTGLLFNSFANIGGKYFGCASNGIYEINTDYKTDDGDLINWQIRTGLLDLEKQKALFRARHAWLGYKSDGHITMSVITDDGVEYNYEVIGYSTNDKGARAKFGKGLRDRYIAIDIQSVKGSSLELDKIRLFAQSIAHKGR